MRNFAAHKEKVYDIAQKQAKNVKKKADELYALAKENNDNLDDAKDLAKLLKDGRIQLITKGRYSKYFRV